MYSIVIPGKTGTASVGFPTAADALKKYRELEAEGVVNIDVRDVQGARVGAFELEEAAGNEPESEQA